VCAPSTGSERLDRASSAGQASTCSPRTPPSPSPTAEERAGLERAAHIDALTRLQNQAALEAALARHADTIPIGVLVLDFDGMRAANAAFANDYARGGDVLIVAVAQVLERFAGPGELAARMHTHGDEFCLPPHRQVYRAHPSVRPRGSLASTSPRRWPAPRSQCTGASAATAPSKPRSR